MKRSLYLLPIFFLIKKHDFKANMKSIKRKLNGSYSLRKKDKKGIGKRIQKKNLCYSERIEKIMNRNL